MQKAILKLLSACLVFCTPLFAQQWRNIGPEGKSWYSSNFFSWGDYVVLTGSYREYYIYHTIEKSGWGCLYIDNYVSASCGPTSIIANRTTWYTLPNCTDDKVCEYHDLDNAWQPIAIPGIIAYVGCVPPRFLSVAGDTLVVGISGKCLYGPNTCIPSYFGMFLSENGGKNWKSLIPEKDCRTEMGSLFFAGNAIIASTSRGIISFNRKTLDTTVMPVSLVFSQLYEFNGTFYGVRDIGNYLDPKLLYYSLDSCKSWTSFNSGLPDSVRISCLESFDSTIYLSSTNKGLFVYDRRQNRWQSNSSFLPETTVHKLCSVNGSIYAATAHGVYRYGNSAVVSNQEKRTVRGSIGLQNLRIFYPRDKNHIFIADNKNTIYDLTGKKLNHIRIDNKREKPAAGSLR